MVLAVLPATETDETRLMLSSGEEHRNGTGSVWAVLTLTPTL